MTVPVILIIAVIVLDQVSKMLLAPALEAAGGSIPLIQDILHLTYVENRGAAFGMLADHRWIFLSLSVIGIGAIFVWLVYSVTKKPESMNMWTRIAVAFIIGGGIGNMIDRVRLGYVVDFIDCRFINFYVFNVADSFVCIGCAMFLLTVIKEEIDARGKKKAAQTETKTQDVSDG